MNLYKTDIFKNYTRKGAETDKQRYFEKIPEVNFGISPFQLEDYEAIDNHSVQ